MFENEFYFAVEKQSQMQKKVYFINMASATHTIMFAHIHDIHTHALLFFLLYKMFGASSESSESSEL